MIDDSTKFIIFYTIQKVRIYDTLKKSFESRKTFEYK